LRFNNKIYLVENMSLQILSPLNNPDEVLPLIEEGAGAFYCGLMPKEWRENYTVAASLNRRQEDNPVIKTSPHMTSFADLEKCVSLANSRSVPVILTLNEHYYSNPQYEFLTKYVEEALKAGVGTFIVGDIGMMLTIKEMDPNIKIHVSTAGTAFNSETVHFYRDLGASRVILPRHLSLEEIGAIAEKTEGIELEAFILNSRCANVDGFCTFQHGLADFIPERDQKKNYENACMVLYNITADVRGVDEDEAEEILKNKISWERQHFWSAMHIDDRPCGACALFDFEEMGLAGVKIVGRQNKTEKKLKDAKFIKKLLDYIHNEKPEKKAYYKYCRELYQQMYDSPCLIFKCYYPSVMEGVETK